MSDPSPSAPSASHGVPSQVVIFGASGDLTQRKLIPALASLCGKGRPKEGFSVLGVARRDKSDEAFRNELREAIEPGLRDGFDRLAPNIHYLAGDVGATLNVERVFKNGVSMGAWATKTNVSSAQFGEGTREN